MSADAKLYVNKLKWDISDLVDIVHLNVNKVFGTTLMPEMKSDYMNGVIWMYYILKGGPGMVMITVSSVGGFPALVITANARREKAKGLLKTIAQQIGGMYMDSEMHGTFEEFEDNFASNEDFMLKSIQKGGSCYRILGDDRKNQDIDQLVESLNRMKTPTNITEG